MLIDGEKWACDACVRGHRVSNCQHADRQLQHIAKKGRPVSQCGHCRTLRKSRSAHVKCECGEKAHSKGACPTTKEESKDSCCCSHGGRCACALKKEHLDPVPESDSDECSSGAPSVGRPRSQTVQSDSAGLTVFTNGHHKPAHKHNQMAHKCGLPYVIPRAHSIHGSSTTNMANRSVDNLLHTSTTDTLHGSSQIKDSIISAQGQQRMVKSEHNSPTMSPGCNSEQTMNQLAPLDMSGAEAFDYNFPLGYDAFGPMDQPIFSAGLAAASVDWSHYDGLEFNNDNFATSEFSQAPSFTNFDFSSVDQPALTTTSTSGEISEVEDFGPFSDTLPHRPAMSARQVGSDIAASEDGYRLSNKSSYLGMQQAQAPTNETGSLDIDEFLKDVANSNYASMTTMPVTTTGFEEQKFLPLTYDSSSVFGLPNDEDDSLWMTDFASGTLPLPSGDSETQKQSLWAQ